MQDHPPSSMSPSPASGAEIWQVYWKKQGQPWRSEPPVDEERQQRLSLCVHGAIDIEQGKYPFRDMRLGRADVEWLLAAVEQRSAQESIGGGNDRKPPGLDVRGADLSGVDLSHLPLVRLHAGLSLEEGRHATVEQSRQAAANLAKADLSHAQLQGAQLSWAALDEAVLVEAHLEGADLGKATLKRAILAGTHLEGVDLTRAQMEGSTLLEAHLEGAFLQGASLEGANLSYGPYIFSCLLDVLAGYGYKPGRTLIAYLVTILSFAIIYEVLGHLAGYQPAMSPLYALVVSIISSHGRGFFPGGFLPTLPMAVCAACEAIIGLTIEISFIATFTQRYYGK